MQTGSGQGEAEMRGLLGLFFTLFALLAHGAEIKLDSVPDKSADFTALKNGAKTFASYCSSCHSASSVQVDKLRDIGFSAEEIKQNFAAGNTNEPMRIAMRREDAKIWLGTVPPDLALIARARRSDSGSGPDWLYTFLRGFYRDDSRPTGWNNVAFENTGMPHALWELQGIQVMGENHRLKLEQPGKLTSAEYDALVADLVNFLQYVSEPEAQFRRELGIFVLIFLAVLLGFAYILMRSYWKNIN